MKIMCLFGPDCQKCHRTNMYKFAKDEVLNEQMVRLWFNCAGCGEGIALMLFFHEVEDEDDECDRLRLRRVRV